MGIEGQPMVGVDEGGSRPASAQSVGFAATPEIRLSSRGNQRLADTLPWEPEQCADDHADDDAASELLALALEAFEEGDWLVAEATMEDAVNALRTQSQYSEDLGTALTDLSRLYCDNMKYERARDAATQALGIADVIGYDTVVALSAMSRRLIAGIKLKEEIEDLIQRALGWLDDHLEHQTPELLAARATLICTLAGCRRHQDRAQEAHELDQQFQLLCSQNPDWKSSQRNLGLGRIYARQNRKRESLALLDLSKSCLRSKYSRSHPEICGISLEQAETWRQLGELKYAEKCFELALKGMVANPQCFTEGQVQWCRDHLRDCILARKQSVFNPDDKAHNK